MRILLCFSMMVLLISSVQAANPIKKSDNVSQLEQASKEKKERTSRGTPVRNDVLPRVRMGKPTAPTMNKQSQESFEQNVNDLRKKKFRK